MQRYSKNVNSARCATQNSIASLSLEDDIFFNRKDTGIATEALIYLSRANIFPGAILEGNSISDARYRPVTVVNRNPITVSAIPLNKAFSKIFSNGTENYTAEEDPFFENTDFKVLILGSDSDYTVQTIKGNAEFLNLIANSTLSEQAYRVPVACTFADANTLEVIETTFVNNILIEPLFVHLRADNIQNTTHSNNDYRKVDNIYLTFFSDRKKTRAVRADTDLIFEIHYTKSTRRSTSNVDTWPRIEHTHNVEEITDKIKNLDFATERFLFESIQSRSTMGTEPTPDMTHPNIFSRTVIETKYGIKPSPFFLIL